MIVGLCEAKTRKYCPYDNLSEDHMSDYYLDN